jgi:hypothetical protein
MSYEFKTDVEQVYALLTDPQFLVDRCLGIGELDAECEVEEGDGVVSIDLKRKVQRELPGLLAKMFDPEQNLHMREEWQPDGEGGYSGKYLIEIQGQPANIAATFELYPTEDGCCYTITHKAKAKIPLVGSKVEKYIQGQTQDGCAAELDYLRDHLG